MTPPTRCAFMGRSSVRRIAPGDAEAAAKYLHSHMTSAIEQLSIERGDTHETP